MPQDVRHLVSKLALTGDPIRCGDLPQVDSPLITEGIPLFFSKALSGEMDVAYLAANQLPLEPHHY